MNISSIALATTVLVGCVFNAGAAEVYTVSGTGSTGNCQAALPVYDGLIRKRPLAVINEGTTGAFVTCAYTTEEISIGVKNFMMDFTNLSAVTARVSCTAVVGEESANAQYKTKFIDLMPGQTNTLEWTDLTDNAGQLFDRSIALSCNLPPRVGMNRNRVTTVLSII